MKRLRSGIALMTSTTLRSSRRKSPAFSGILSAVRRIVRAVIETGGQRLAGCRSRGCGARRRPSHSRRATWRPFRPITSGGSCRSTSIGTTALAAGMVEPGGERRFLAEIARQRQRADARIGASAPRRWRPASRRALPSSTNRISQPSCGRPSEDRRDPGEEGRRPFLLVLDRHDDRQQRIAPCGRALAARRFGAGDLARLVGHVVSNTLNEEDAAAKKKNVPLLYTCSNHCVSGLKYSSQQSHTILAFLHNVSS